MIQYFFDSLIGTILLSGLMAFVVGTCWVLKVALDEFMRAWGIDMTVLWKDVPDSEKRAVKSIENRQRYIRKLRDEGKMKPEKHVEEIEKLEKRLDEIWRLGNENL